MKIALAALVVLLGSTVGSGDSSDDVQQVRAAIAAIRSQPASVRVADIGRSAELIFSFAESSPRVMIQIAKPFTSFMGEPYGPLLLAYYIAGAVEFDLDHPDRRDELAGDTTAAIELVLPRYREVKRRDPSYTNTFLERADHAKRYGRLASFIAEVWAKQPPTPAAPNSSSDR